MVGYSQIKEEICEANECTTGNKWETISARVSPEEKEEIYRHCKHVVKLPFSVVSRLIWRRILNDHRTMPQPETRRDELREVERCVDEVMYYMPLVRKQRQQHFRFID